MRLITPDDLVDVYSKLRQRGGRFLWSKLTLNKRSRTKSAFDETSVTSSNWWIIPYVQKRWNQLITGKPNLKYEAYFVNKYLKGRKEVKMISLGSGSCSHELEFAAYPHFQEIVCVDIAENRLEKGKSMAKERGLTNIQFLNADIQDLELSESGFDIVLFNSSLHHMYHVEEILKERVRKILKPGGLLLINEYVGCNRLQYPPEQLQSINEALTNIDKAYRRRFKTDWLKKRYYGSGWLRMFVADPSECVDAESILPALRKHFIVLEEKPYGGNLLMPVLKDIAHHFVVLDSRKKAVLDHLFQLEDDYIERQSSDFMFGVYKNPK